MSCDQPITTRFPPSPTGYLHIGGARTALFNWAMARRHGGRFLLRMEDTDRARSSEAAERSILDDLRWLGLEADNEGDLWRQSERAGAGVYDGHVERLLEAGLAYPDADDPAGRAVRFRMPGESIVFSDLVRGEVATDAGTVGDFVIRKADGMPTYHLAVVVDDAAMGVSHVIRGNDHLSNTAKHIALQRALGLPTPIYGHISLTTNPDGSKLGKRDKAKAARAAFWAHVGEGEDPAPFAREVEASTGGACRADQVEALARRESDDLGAAEAVARRLGCGLPEVDVRDFRNAGYLPTPLLNFLGLLGWNPGENVERFEPDALTFLRERFDPARFVKGNATFDRQKLDAFNAEWIREMAAEAFAEALGGQALIDRPFRPIDKGPWRAMAAGAPGKFAAFAAAYQPRATTLESPFEQGWFFVAGDREVAAQYDFNTKNVKKVMLKGEPTGFESLQRLRAALADHADLPDEAFGAAAHETIRRLAESTGLNMGKFAQPLRVAVSASTVTPPLDQTLSILGAERTLARIDLCLNAAPGPDGGDAEA